MALLLFRLAWGVVGSDTALFRRFLKSPLAAFRHLRHLRRRPADTEIGHNAAGGWMVLLMLLLLCVQVATGLCANDEISTQGPLADTVGPDGCCWFTEWASGRVGRIAPDGHIETHPLADPASEPHGITSGPDGALLAALETGSIARLVPA